MKDLIYIRRLYLKIVIMLFLFYLLLAVFSAQDGEAMDSSPLSSALILLFSVFPVATFTLDKAAHWDRYALSGPIDRRMMVLSKYILSWGSILAGALTSIIYILALSLLQGGSHTAGFLEGLQFAVFFAFAGLIFNSVMLPCVYRFGAEKARLLLFILVGLPFVAALLGRVFHISAPSEGQMRMMGYLVPVLAVLGTYLSYRLSLHIYQKQAID